jgi:hypothetical protein
LPAGPGQRLTADHRELQIRGGAALGEQAGKRSFELSQGAILGVWLAWEARSFSFENSHCFAMRHFGELDLVGMDSLPEEERTPSNRFLAFKLESQ